MLVKQLFRRTVTPFQMLLMYYFCAILFSFGLLRLPWVHKEGVEISLIDSLFTAVSAVSVTGLTTINIAESYTQFGHAMVLVILQIGAIGIMSIGTFVWLLVGKKIGMRERQMIMIDHNQYNLSGVVQLIREIALLLFAIELTGALILTFHFKRSFVGWEEAFFHGLFTAISATTNGGFDITGMSMQPFHHDYFVQFVTMVLIMLGAIGFPVLIEVKTFLLRKNKSFRFSLFTKITTATYGILFLFGAAIIFLIEIFHSFRGMKWHEAIMTALYHSSSTRSAGLSTVDVQTFSEATNLFVSVLMFIGASPSSVGGGIRTTTFAIVILFLITYARGRSEIQVFKREIHFIDVSRSFVVILLAGFLVLVSMMVLHITEPGATTTQILFEVTSAFGTCGMSLGLTEHISTIGKWVLMMLMFIGRVGIISFLYSIGGRAKKLPYHYPKERVIIG